MGGYLIKGKENWACSVTRVVLPPSNVSPLADNGQSRRVPDHQTVRSSCVQEEAAASNRGGDGVVDMDCSDGSSGSCWFRQDDHDEHGKRRVADVAIGEGSSRAGKRRKTQVLAGKRCAQRDGCQDGARKRARTAASSDRFGGCGSSSAGVKRSNPSDRDKSVKKKAKLETRDKKRKRAFLWDWDEESGDEEDVGIKAEFGDGGGAQAQSQRFARALFL